MSAELKLKMGVLVAAFAAAMVLLHCLVLLVGSALAISGQPALLTAELAALAIILPLVEVFAMAHDHAVRTRSAGLITA